MSVDLRANFKKLTRPVESPPATATTVSIEDIKQCTFSLITQNPDWSTGAPEEIKAFNYFERTPPGRENAKNINDTSVINYSPAYNFGAVKCINKNLFDSNRANKNFIIFEYSAPPQENNGDDKAKQQKPADTLDTIKISGKARYSNPATNSNWFVNDLSSKIAVSCAELTGDNDFSNAQNTDHQNLLRFLVWTAMIDITNPPQKSFNESASSSNGSSQFYTDKTSMFLFCKNATITKAHFSAAAQKFIKLFKSFIQNNYEKLNLFEYCTNADDLNTSITNIVDETYASFFNSHGQDIMPMVIDTQYGEYSTVNTIINIATDALSKVFSGQFNNTLKIREMSDWGARGNSFNLEEYARIFGWAVGEVLRAETWKHYNESAAVNFILDNAITSVEVASLAEALAVNTKEYLESVKAADEYAERTKSTMYTSTSESWSMASKNDIRAKVRNGRNDGDNCYYKLQDYNWSIDWKKSELNNVSLENFPHLTIFEFQPDRQVSHKRMVEGLIGDATKLLGSKMQNGIFSSGAVQGLISTVTTGVRNSTSSTATESQNYSTNVSWVDNLLDGWWVGQYEIPYFGEKYLGANTIEHWSMGNLMSASDFLVNDLTLNVQDIPTWKYAPGDDPQLEHDFYLLNDTFGDVINNLKFLFAFIAGSYWMQESAKSYRSPNLYRVFCPGRFVMLYAAMSTNVTYCGKIRNYSSGDAEKLFGSKDTTFAPFKRFLDGEDCCNIPEAYKISISLKNLTPQAFNIFASYQNAEISNIYPNITTKVIGKKSTTTAVSDIWRELV